jgi:hypothetical protein
VGHETPLVHDDGRLVKVVCAEFSEQLPLPGSLSRKPSVPPVPSTAIQYVVPLVTAAFEPRVSLFHCPPAGAAVEPEASNPPGWPLLSVYKPTVSPVALEPPST